MPDTPPKKWKLFESIVSDIQKKISPDAKITRNGKFHGKRSQTLREIDIAIQQKIGQYDIFIAVDCKDYKRPIDVGILGTFIDLVNDVGANKGVMVASNGFTDSAKKRAVEAGIIIYTLVDTEKHDWGSDVSIPFLCDFRRIKSVSFKFMATGFF